MQERAYEGYFEGGQFYTAGKAVRIPGRRRAVLTIFNEQVQEDTSTDWVDELERMIKEDTSEKLHMENFPRANFTREHYEVKS